MALLDHGHLLALPSNKHATYGLDQLRHFMGAHQAELAAAHVHADRALQEWAYLKEHSVKHLANTSISKMWEALAPKREHVP